MLCCCSWSSSVGRKGCDARWFLLHYLWDFLVVWCFVGFDSLIALLCPCSLVPFFTTDLWSKAASTLDSLSVALVWCWQAAAAAGGGKQRLWWSQLFPLGRGPKPLGLPNNLLSTQYILNSRSTYSIAEVPKYFWITLRKYLVFHPKKKQSGK